MNTCGQQHRLTGCQNVGTRLAKAVPTLGVFLQARPNNGDQWLATLGLAAGLIHSRVRCIDWFGVSLSTAVSRDTEEVPVDRELAGLAVRAPAPAEGERRNDFGCPAARASGNRGPRVDLELGSATQAVVRVVVADAQGQPLVVRVVGVLLGPGLIDVIRIAIRPCLNGPVATVAHKPLCLSHAHTLRCRTTPFTCAAAGETLNPEKP